MICVSFAHSPSRGQPDYYTTSLSLCQEVFQKFFKFFSNFFQPTFRSAEKCPSIISHPFRFVKGFLKSFSTFFAISFRGHPRGVFLVDSLHIIALSFSFVKHFLTSFLSLEDWAFPHNQPLSICALCPIYRSSVAIRPRMPFFLDHFIFCLTFS